MSLLSELRVDTIRPMGSTQCRVKVQRCVSWIVLFIDLAELTVGRCWKLKDGFFAFTVEEECDLFIPFIVLAHATAAL